jgi:hypothetical protein
MTVESAREKSFEFAQDTTKQLITLATAIVALTITFVRDLAQAAPNWSLYVLAIGWLAYFVSILFGVFTLMTLTGAVHHVQATIDEDSLRKMAVGQVLAFIAGTALAIVFGVAAVFHLA